MPRYFCALFVFDCGKFHQKQTFFKQVNIKITFKNLKLLECREFRGLSNLSFFEVASIKLVMLWPIT